jgi:hypothetical protein
MRGGRVPTSSLYAVAEHGAQVQLRQAAHDGLVHHRVVLDRQGRVLGRDLREHVVDASDVARALGFDRQAEHRPGEVERLHVDVVLVVRVVQHAVEDDVVDLGHRADVARHEPRHLDHLLALQQERVRDLERLLAVADVELRVRADRALVHAEHADLADEGVVPDLEHVREHVLLRIGFGTELLGLVALAAHEQRRVAFAGVRHVARDHVEQVLHARAGARRHEAHRHDVALAQRLLERLVQRGRVDRTLLEIALHRRVVDLDDLLHDLPVHVGHRQEVRLAAVLVEAVDHAFAAVGRQVDRQYL